MKPAMAIALIPCIKGRSTLNVSSWTFCKAATTSLVLEEA